MAKRYHQSVKDRMAESRGEERHMMQGHYAGMEPRRRQEMEDAGMIHEDHSAVANLPQNVMMKPWPGKEGYLPEVEDDTIRGVNRQMAMDHGKMMQNFVPKKV